MLVHDRYFMWQLSFDTYRRFVNRIYIDQTADYPNTYAEHRDIKIFQIKWNTYCPDVQYLTTQELLAASYGFSELQASNKTRVYILVLWTLTPLHLNE
jgi:hypothetical protein